MSAQYGWLAYKLLQFEMRQWPSSSISISKFYLLWKKERKERKNMNYILQNQMTSKCISSGSQLILSSNTNIYYLE